MNDQTKKPLCVDLDGTLVRTDTLTESFLLCMKDKPYLLPVLPIWLMRGRARLKKEICYRITLEASTLPYNEEVLEFLENERKQRKVVLVTAADQRIADSVAQHTEIFHSAHGSDGVQNLSGETKAEFLCRLFGESGFDYIGNSKTDLPVWKAADKAHIISNDKNLIKKIASQANLGRHFAIRKNNAFLTFFRAIRMHQWLKNILVFVPLLAAHKLTEIILWEQALTAFFAFSFVASGIYLLNDLLDLSADRKHHKKRFRPFAAGEIPVLAGLIMSPIMLLGGIAIAALLPNRFLYLLLVYVALTILYSYYLKRIMLVDIILLASLYTLRIVAGAAAVRVPLSFWLLAFSMFFFLSLAFAKRFSELYAAPQGAEPEMNGRGYLPQDIEQLSSLGTASGYISVLVWALYINNEAVTELYSRPEVLWLFAPVLLYWISRVWILARRGKMHQDPIVFAVEDKMSYPLAIITILILYFASSV